MARLQPGLPHVCLSAIGLDDLSDVRLASTQLVGHCVCIAGEFDKSLSSRSWKDVDGGGVKTLAGGSGTAAGGTSLGVPAQAFSRSASSSIALARGREELVRDGGIGTCSHALPLTRGLGSLEGCGLALGLEGCQLVPAMPTPTNECHHHPHPRWHPHEGTQEGGQAHPPTRCL